MGDARRDFAIRPAAPADADAILDCLRSAFQEYRKSYTPLAYSDTVQTRETFFQRLRQMTVLVATSPEGEIVGTISCTAVGDGEGHLRGLAVRPGRQGLGIASALLQAAESELRGRLCSRITLDTTAPLERAVLFYEKRGFRRSSRVADFFGMPLFEYVKSLDESPAGR